MDITGVPPPDRRVVNFRGLRLEAMAAKQFRASNDDIAVNREAVLRRGRPQVR